MFIFLFYFCIDQCVCWNAIFDCSYLSFFMVSRLSDLPVRCCREGSPVTRLSYRCGHACNTVVNMGVELGTPVFAFLVSISELHSICRSLFYRSYFFKITSDLFCVKIYFYNIALTKMSLNIPSELISESLLVKYFARLYVGFIFR